MRTLLKHALIVVERLQLTDGDSSKLPMSRIDQAIVLMWGENGRNEEDAARAGGDKFIAEPGELGRDGASSPVRWQIVHLHTLFGYIFRNFGNGQNQIGWRIVLIQVDEVLQHG